MELKCVKNYKNMDVFIRSVFVECAKQSEVPIAFDYINKHGNLFDFYFPQGLSLLRTRVPTYVKICHSDIEEQMSKFATSSNHSSPVIVLIYLGGERKNPDGFNSSVRILDVNFINVLISQYNDIFINYALGEKESEIKVIDRKSDELFRREYHYTKESERSETITLLFEDSFNLYIHENTPEILAGINKDLFKAFLKDRYHMYKDESVALILGNGISIPFGTDSWTKLIDNLLDSMTPYHISDPSHIRSFLNDSSYAISSFAKCTFDRDSLSKKYDAALYSSIYRKFHSLMLNENTIIKAIARGKEKYPKIPILTYNYDTFVEQQYENITGNYLNHNLCDDYAKDPSFGVIHLHGYIGYTTGKSKDIILTDKEYFDAYLGHPKSKVRDVQINALTNYKCLFIGSSMSDLFQMSIIQDVARKEGKRWCCFAVMCFNGLTLNEKIQLMKFYRDKGIYIILAKDFEHMPDVVADLLDVRF